MAYDTFFKRISKRSCGPSKEDLKFTIEARNYKITLQLTGDLRSICVQKCVCVVHGGVTFLMKKAFPFGLGPLVRFKPISNSQ
jgi:hypothetical protein